VGRVLGKREEFLPIILPLVVQEQTEVSHNIIRILHHPPRLKENDRGILRFELQNHSPMSLEQIEITLGGRDWAVQGDAPRLNIQNVNAGESIVFPVHVMPVQAGRIELNLYLYGMTGSQAYNHCFTFEYQIEPDLRPRVQHTEIRTGDIMNLRGVLSLTGDSVDNTTQPNHRTPGPVFQLGQSEQPQVPQTTQCPHCKEQTEDKHYCNKCGKRLRASEPGKQLWRNNR
jgi:hypothetical protein